MTDAPAPKKEEQPDNTEWVVVRHRRFPLPSDNVIGIYADLPAAQAALNGLLMNAEWFCSYTIEHRAKV